MAHWAFEELRGAAVRRNPNETELFKTEHTLEGEYAGNDALVREILQNSIDAHSGDGPVRVRLAIHSSDEAPATNRLAHYFERLRAPLTSREVEFNGQGVPRIPCRFLVVEDFGTCGLEGDPLLFRDPLPGETSQQYFYWFWRNIGRSGKTGDDLGRWGLGKTVYRAASRVRCMFGLTVRNSDRRRLLMGQAILQSHEHKGKEYQPEGYWCGSQNAEGLPLPIDEEDELSRFCKEWHLSRTDQPGLSVVSPYVPDELKPERLLQAVAVNFFTRIVRGELEVEVVGPEIGSVILDRARIAAACKSMTWDGPKRTKRHVPPPIDFARQCLSTTPKVVTEVLGKERIPELNEAVFDERTLHEQRKRFSAGELISVCVRLSLPRKEGPAQEGQLDVYLQRTSEGLRCDSYYVREGMTITKINSQASRRGVQGMVVVDAGPLAVLLGDTEGAAHEDWDTSQDRPDRTWKAWKGRVRFVRGIVDRLVELLTPPATEPDFDLLSDFFSIERVGGPQRRRQQGDDAKMASGMDAVVAEPKWYNITSRAGGFTVSRVASVPLSKDTALKVSVAYDLPRGNPLNNWNRLDFEISTANGGLRPVGKGLTAQSVGGNVVLLKDIRDDFSFAVEGFDRHRDLYVRVDEVTNSDEAIT